MIQQKVIKLLSEYLGRKPEEIKENTRLIEDLGIDSLATIELVMHFEDEFNIEIEDEDAYKMRIVKDIIDFIQTN